MQVGRLSRYASRRGVDLAEDIVDIHGQEVYKVSRWNCEKMQIEAIIGTNFQAFKVA